MVRFSMQDPKPGKQHRFLGFVLFLVEQGMKNYFIHLKLR